MTLDLSRLLVPVDGSASSGRALELAMDLASTLSSHIQLLSIVNIRESELYDGLYLSDTQVEALKNERDRELLEPAAAKCQARGIPSSREVRVGNPQRELLHAIETSAPQLVVVGRSGKGMIARMLEGSISRGVIAKSFAPVLVVP